MKNWNKESLHRFVNENMRGRRLIVVSNREPYIHTREGSGIRCHAPASGLTTALDPILKACGGTWVAHGSGSADADVVDARDLVRVPPETPSYSLRRVWLPKRIEHEYYYGLANEGLWPLCHAAFQKPEFSLTNWLSYKAANRLFADAVLEEADGEAAFVFVQDYHLALLPRMLRERNPNLTIAQFWHIPWPHCDAFRAFPWKEELLDGMLGNHLLGFHLQEYCWNFMDAVKRNFKSLVDPEDECGSRNTMVRPFPIGIDFEEQAATAASPEISAETARWKRELGAQPEILGLGIDRIDYTKGIPNRLQAIETLLASHPEYIGRMVFLQIGVPSRTAIGPYETLNRELCAQVEAINTRWGRGSWKPIIFVRRQVELLGLTALHLMADFCLVSSLDDGMNLVAKEFVASRIDGDGVLILSRFTGAARELTDAVIVNPFAVDDLAKAIHGAVEMPAVERRRRMNNMRAAVSANTVYTWAGGILGTMAEIGLRDAAPSYVDMGPRLAYAGVGQ